MKKEYPFPNQICAVKNCEKSRRYLVIIEGAAINLCEKHHSNLDEEKPIVLKEVTWATVMRDIRE